MVSVKVIPEKGVEYSVYEKNGKHRVYFKMNNGGGRPIEVGNYDIIEGKFFPARGATLVWNVVEKSDNPQALIVIGDSKQIFVGKSSTPAPKQAWGGNKSFGGNNNNRDRDIKRGMCFKQCYKSCSEQPCVSCYG